MESSITDNIVANTVQESSTNVFEHQEQLITDGFEDPEQETERNSLLNEHSNYIENVFVGDTLMELSKSSWSKSKSSAEDVQPYLRGCKWSPDGTCCLCVVNNDGVHVIDLPRDLYSDSVSTTRPTDILNSAVHVKESGLVYDFCWYPAMNSSYPDTCCWLTTLQNSPIQLWDAYDGSLRCSYRGFNSVDEMEPAISITFTVDASKIVAGYKKDLKTFDVSRPGRECSTHKISSPAACLAVDNNLLAVGSWNTTISLYNVSEMGTYKSVGKMHGHSGGVTNMKFTPDGLKLVSGARKDHRLLIWDIRYYRRPLNILSRIASTNQRIYFDISPCGRYLISGGTDGILRVWDSQDHDWTSSDVSTKTDSDKAIYKFPLHRDCCNGVSVHPYKTILATASGQYHCSDPISILNDERREGCEENPNSEIVNTNLSVPMDVSYPRKHEYTDFSENNLVFWWTGVVPETDLCKA